jgi:DNA-binding response OmpR family regulator
VPSASLQIVILAPDDDSRVVVERLLTARGLSVMATDDPRVAASLARAGTTELLLADLSTQLLEAVPRWSRRREDPELVPPTAAEGYALLRSLAHDPMSGHLPLLTLQDGSTDRCTAQRFGVLDVIAKPVDGERLRAKVARALTDGAVPAPTATAPEREADQGAPLAFDVIPRAMRRALIVDGDAGFRKWIRGQMAIHGFRVYEAEDAEQALAAALAERPWLVLCELALPGDTDGLDLCRRLRAQALTAHLPIVLLSGHDEYEDRYRGIEAGADDFVSKHVTAREMLIRIQLVLKRYAKLGTPVGRDGAAIGGRLELVGAPGVLQMCHLSQLSGVLRVRHGSDSAEFDFGHGQILSARTPHAQGADAVYAFMEWTEGHFEFVPGATRPGTPLAKHFDELLLEGCRRLDEGRRSRAVEALTS